MIKAYVENWKPYTCGFDQYVKNTVLSKCVEDVIKRITGYLSESNCGKDVERFLRKILFTPEVLGKVQIVYDGSGRNVVFLVRPDGVSFTGSDGSAFGKTHEEKLLFYASEAETIFLNLDEETWAEVYLMDEIEDGAYEEEGEDI